ncbi:cyclase family protein [Ruicaihuangia caeni]|uniref:Cyclase family protein n=1 Tax=Ruicaihuangia caeni TaxID=3042517 RepID=A0AAW6T5I7_9MICO|nr:cyclase family protein [Klugiella sp. YN-L-19]MDI2099037.1 cyclase family protein [Klugiella sp. YN-L-19]
MTDTTVTSAEAGSKTGIAALLADLADGRIEVLDLTAPLSATTPALRLPAPFPNLIDLSLEKVAAFDDDGPFWAHNNIHVGEHYGTHVDAPAHWVSGRDGRDVSQLPVERLVGEAAVIDMTAEVEADPDFLLEIEHIEAWQSEHGPLPVGGWLLYRTGWDQYGHDEKLFLNTDADGASHTPGVSAACAKWLAEETPLAGFGVETVGIDAGRGFELDPPFPVHYHLLGNDKYGVTSLKNLDRLPARGALIVVTPLPIVGGTASPARVLALVEQS